LAIDVSALSKVYDRVTAVDALSSSLPQGTIAAYQRSTAALFLWLFRVARKRGLLLNVDE
jgi:hypothetical protein